MLRRNIPGLVLLVGLLVSAPADAVVRNDNTAGNPALVPGSVYITSTVNNIVGTGTVVGNGRYVLTAGHVIQDLGGAAGTNFSFRNNAGNTATGMGTATFVVPGAAPNNFTPDWGLIPINGTLPGSVAIAGANPAVDTTVTFASWGASDPAAGSGQQRRNPGTIIQGQNVLNFVDNTNQAIGFDFDLAGANGTDPGHTINQVAINDDKGTDVRDGLGNAEATTFGGDSGMGILANISGTLTLVGVYDGRTAQSGLNADQVESYGTPVDSFRDQVNAVFAPEPSTIGVMAIVGVGTLSRRRRFK